jgi:hypothetical protein
MKTRLMAVPAILALTAGLACAQTDTPAVVTAPAPETVTFQLNLKPNTARAQRMVVDVAGTMQMPGNQGSMPVNVRMEASTKFFVDKKNDDGTYNVRYRIGGIKMSMNGQPMPTGMAESLELKAVLAKDGRATKVTGLENVPGGMGVDPTQMMRSALMNNIGLPDKPLAVGETWTTTIPMPFDPSGSSNVQVVSKLNSVETVKGQRIANIESKMSGPMNMTMQQPVPMTMTGQMDGTTTMRLDAGSGLPIDSTGVTKLKMDMTMDNPAGNGEKMNMTMDMTVTARLEPSVAIDPNPKAAPGKAVTPKKK